MLHFMTAWASRLPNYSQHCTTPHQASHRVRAGRVYFQADKPIEHHRVELELESSLGRGDIGQASWLTLPLIVLLVTAILQWDKVDVQL